MIANYHTHTPRCNHANGTEQQYADAALQAGLKILGFSDHTPYIFPGEYYSTFRMRLSQLDDYVQAVLRVRKEYAGKLDIPLGLELEYYPGLLPKLLPILRDQPMDYLILGQHFIGNEYDAPYSGLVTDDKEVVRQYCRQSMEAMNTGLFTYFAHPDLIHYQDDWKFYMDSVRPMCAEAKQCGVPLEINLLGIREGRHYPNRYFWEMAAEEGCDVILGVDAHSPQAMNHPESVQKGLALAKEFGLNVLETAELRSIHR